MDNNHKIAIIGGGGRTGKHLVSQLSEQGFQLKLLLRNPEQNIFTGNFNVEVVEGDVLDYKIVKELLKNCEAIISTIGQRQNEPLVASQAIINVLKAIKENELPVKRYILLAGLNVDTPFDKKCPETVAATKWMKSNFPEIHEDRQKSYRILAESEASWTLVRVPFIEFTEDRRRLSVSLEDSPGAKISAADIAGFLIDQINDKTYLRKSPFIANC